MASPSPWSIKGIDPDARQAAKAAAKRSGVTLGAWLNAKIMAEATGAGDGHTSERASGARRDSRPTASASIESTANIGPFATAVRDVADRLKRDEVESDAAISEIRAEIAALTDRFEVMTAHVDDFSETISLMQVDVEAGRQIAKEARDEVAALVVRVDEGEIADDTPAAYDSIQAAIADIADHLAAERRQQAEVAESNARAFEQLDVRVGEAARQGEDTAAAMGHAVSVIAQRIDTLEDHGRDFDMRIASLVGSREPLAPVDEDDTPPMLSAATLAAFSAGAAASPGAAEFDQVAESDGPDSPIADADPIAADFETKGFDSAEAPTPDAPPADSDDCVAPYVAEAERELRRAAEVDEKQRVMAEHSHMLDRLADDDVLTGPAESETVEKDAPVAGADAAPTPITVRAATEQVGDGGHCEALKQAEAPQLNRAAAHEGDDEGDDDSGIASSVMALRARMRAAQLREGESELGRRPGTRENSRLSAPLSRLLNRNIAAQAAPQLDEVAVYAPSEPETLDPIVEDEADAAFAQVEAEIVAQAEVFPAEPQIAEPQIAEPGIAEPQIAEPQIAEPQIAEPGMVDDDTLVSTAYAEVDPNLKTDFDLEMDFDLKAKFQAQLARITMESEVGDTAERGISDFDHAFGLSAGPSPDADAAFADLEEMEQADARRDAAFAESPPESLVESTVGSPAEISVDDESAFMEVFGASTEAAPGREGIDESFHAAHLLSAEAIEHDMRDEEAEAAVFVDPGTLPKPKALRSGLLGFLRRKPKISAGADALGSDICENEDEADPAATLEELSNVEAAADRKPIMALIFSAAVAMGALLVVALLR